jgi:hypothetical protein
MPSFYSKFPKINYKFADGTEQQLVDINIKYTLSTLVKTTTDVFYPFSYRDHDRPDVLADKYYDSSDYYWLMLMSNDVFDVHHDLPIPYTVFNRYLAHKYKTDAMALGYTENEDDVVGYCFETNHHYEDKDGYVIDFESFQTLGDTVAVSIYDYEYKENEKKRAIRLIEASRKVQVRNELEDNLRKLRSDSNQ